jgi:hypothetical protein
MVEESVQSSETPFQPVTPPVPEQHEDKETPKKKPLLRL